MASPAAGGGGEDDSRARQAFLDGAAAYDEGRYEEALTFFTFAYELSGRPALLYNIALVEDRLRMDREALVHYEAFLEQTGDSPTRVHAETRARILRDNQARDEDLLAEAVRRARQADQDEAEVYESPWLWAGVGAAVIAGVTVALVLTLGDPGVADPSRGTDGSTVFALGF